MNEKVEQHSLIPDSLSKKIGTLYLSRQFKTRFTTKVIEEFIFDLRKAFEEENVKAEIFYDPFPKKDRFDVRKVTLYGYAPNKKDLVPTSKVLWKHEKIGVSVVFKDENDKVSDLLHWCFYMPRIDLRKPIDKLYTVDSI
jgi:hypothetical protein